MNAESAVAATTLDFTSEGRLERVQALTKRIHSRISSSEATSASIDMGLAITRSIKEAHVDFAKLICEKREDPNLSQLDASKRLEKDLDQALSYVVSSWNAQKRWLDSYRARQKVTLRLFSLYRTQLDIFMTLKIAKDIKRDSISMNSIAWLTMVFLPGTFVSVSPTASGTFNM